MAKVPWKMSYKTYEQYLDCIEALAKLDPDYDFEEYGELAERLQLLDGFPRNYSQDTDVIVPVLPKSIAPLVVLNVHE